MKDYKLSEIKAICEKQASCGIQCPIYSFGNLRCIFRVSFLDDTPAEWQIDEEEQDDEVVLTMCEYQELAFYKQQCEKIERLGMTTPQKVLEKYEALQNQVAKETAREILQDFLNYCALYGCVTHSDILKKCEQYEVEVEE